MHDHGDEKFLSKPNQVKFDWVLVLQQTEATYRSAPNDHQRSRIHDHLLQRLEFEREAYKLDILLIARDAEKEMDAMWADHPERDLIFAEYRASIRGDLRTVVAHLGDVEKRLDDAYLGAVRESLSA